MDSPSWYSGRSRFVPINRASFPSGGMSLRSRFFTRERKSFHPSKTTKRMNPAGLILLVLRTGFEPAIFAVRGRCPEPLDDRSVPTQREYPTAFLVSTGSE